LLSYIPAPLVSINVKLPYAIAHRARLPGVLRGPLRASATSMEATTPVKLPAKQCPPACGVRHRTDKGPYFKVGSAHPGGHASQPPAYPTHRPACANAKLQ